MLTAEEDIGIVDPRNTATGSSLWSSDYQGHKEPYATHVAAHRLALLSPGGRCDGDIPGVSAASNFGTIQLGRQRIESRLSRVQFRDACTYGVLLRTAETACRRCGRDGRAGGTRRTHPWDSDSVAPHPLRARLKLRLRLQDYCNIERWGIVGSLTASLVDRH